MLVEDRTRFRTFVDPKFQHFYSACSGSKSTSARVTSAHGRCAQPQLWELEEISPLFSQPTGAEFDSAWWVGRGDRAAKTGWGLCPSAAGHFVCMALHQLSTGHRRQPCSHTLSGKEAPPSSTP